MALLLDSTHSMPFLAIAGRLSDHVVLLCNYGHEINHIKNSEASNRLCGDTIMQNSSGLASAWELES